MAQPSVRVVAVVRHRAAVLCCQGASDGDAMGRSLPSMRLDGGDPEEALGRLLDRLDIAVETVERRGTSAEPGDVRLVSFLVSAAERSVVNEGCPAPTWGSPTDLLRQADDRWWAAYAAVAPTATTVAADTERGSTALAVDALWALRDAASRATVGSEDLVAVEAVARALLEARPSMAALETRVDRAMAGATSPADVETAAGEGIARAHDADATAAGLAAETVAGGRVLTLSRSGTVRAALLRARPAVVVLASRPGGEGVVVADELTVAGLDVETCPDAAVYDRLRVGDIDSVLVGADAVTPDGGVVNKVGTRAAALAAERAGVPCDVVCASDKVHPAADGGGSAQQPPIEPGFDWTPPRLVTELVTERGRLTAAGVRAVAEEHRALARWRDSSAADGS